YSVALLARSHDSLSKVKEDIVKEGGKAEAFPTDVSDEASVVNTFKNIAQKLPGNIEVGIFNASAGFVMKPFLELKKQDIENAFSVSATGAFIFAQAVLREMDKHNKGTLIFTGATASIKGGAKFAAFAPAKFATRALAQSLAREFGPRGIHVAHVIVDGLIDTPAVNDINGPSSVADSLADILDTYLVQQDPSCWTQELDMRPAQEKF
ncbi:NAD(P)-binding protein, partial [Cystobasidium minutum MCA 4210]|uniref:NAD(P)-binding protein n=1 Tax=Cystobasidium minutum MCA 4210 TaxID=1397322 RepID=UPI0034CEA17E